jgi:hypothetical protein
VIKFETRGLKERIKGVADSVEDAVVKVKGETVIRLATGLVKFTPVVTGRLMGGYRARTGAPAEMEKTRSGPLDPSGGALQGQARTVAKAQKVKDDIFINNVVEYFSIVNDGSERVSGRRMVELAVDQVMYDAEARQ